MALTNRQLVLSIPGLANVANCPPGFLDMLIAAAGFTIKKFCKQNLEYTNYVEYYNGSGSPNIIARQRPLWFGTTQIAADSNGAVLPQATINVASTVGFPTGTDGNGKASSLAVQTSTSTWTWVTYTGVTATTFTGCSGGTGTLSTATYQNNVGSPVIFFDQQGYAGQFPSGFADSTIQVQGGGFIVDADDGAAPDQQTPVSNRGLIRRVGGAGFGTGLGSGGYGGGGFGLAGGYGGYNKLAGSPLPFWPRGTGNLKVCYAAGYATVPADLQYAASMLVAQMVRVMPYGTEVSSENLGAATYSVLQNANDTPTLGGIVQALKQYREWSL